MPLKQHVWTGSLWRSRLGDLLPGSDRSVAHGELITAANTGVLPGVTRTTQAGDITITTAGTTLENLTILGRVIVRAAGVTLRNCQVLGDTAQFGSFGSAYEGAPLVDWSHTSATGGLIEDCEIAPQQPHYRWNGVHTGAGVLAKLVVRRTQVHHVQDGFQVNKGSATGWPYPVGVTLEQVWVHSMAKWTYDATGTVHPSDVQSHNDCVQVFGGQNPIIRRCKLDSRPAKQYAHWRAVDAQGVELSLAAASSGAAEPYTFMQAGTMPAFGGLKAGAPFAPGVPDRGTGTEANGRYHTDDYAAIMYSANVGKIIESEVTDNYLLGGVYTVNAGGGNITPGAGYNLGTWKRNTFDRSQGEQSSGGDQTFTLMFAGTPAWDTYDIPLTGADANRYTIDGAGGQLLTGAPVRVRI